MNNIKGVQPGALKSLKDYTSAYDFLADWQQDKALLILAACTESEGVYSYTWSPHGYVYWEGGGQLKAQIDFTAAPNVYPCHTAQDLAGDKTLRYGSS